MKWHPEMDELKHRSSAVVQLPNETLGAISTKDVESDRPRRILAYIRVSRLSSLEGCRNPYSSLWNISILASDHTSQWHWGNPSLFGTFAKLSSGHNVEVGDIVFEDAHLGCVTT